MIDVVFSPPLAAVTSRTSCTCDDVPTVGELIDGLEKRFPGMRLAVLEDRGVLRPHLSVFVNKRSIKRLHGLDTQLNSGDAVFFGVAIAGG